MSIQIPKTAITDENIERMEKSLMITKENSKRRTNTKFYFEPPKIPFFRGVASHLIVPFYWGRSYFGKKYLKKYETMDYNFIGTLRPEQEKLQTESLEYIREHDTVLIAVYPGGGKTITSLSILSHLKMKTLIIVNKIVLVEQWKESIQKFLGIEPFIITGKNCKIKNSQIYIINAINIPKHEFENLNIGCVIVDECHLILTTVFSQGLFHLFPQYLIGLSATPYRTDGFDSLFDLYFGIHRVHRSLYRPHNVLQVVTKTKIEHTLDKQGNINWNSVIDQQCNLDSRKELICNYCMEYKDRNILILCKRIQQMINLRDRLDELGVENVAVFKESDTKFDTNCRILVSSYQKVGTGFSFDKLDMLILGTDTEEYFLQYLGRVFRRLDVRPIVIDIVDDHPILMKHFNSRRKIYKEAGGTIQKIKLEEKK